MKRFLHRAIFCGSSIRSGCWLVAYPWLFLLFIMFGVMATGCGSKVVPVSSITTEKHETDSSTTRKETDKDSSSYRETLTEKKLAGSTVEQTFTKSQMDSLIKALQAMPANVTRTIYRTDPTMQTTLAIMMDSLGRIHIQCATAERTYYEKMVQQDHYISSLVKELTKVNSENSVLKQEITKLKVPFWEQLKNGFNSWLVKILLWFLAVGTAIVIFRETIKKFL